MSQAKTLAYLYIKDCEMLQIRLKKTEWCKKYNYTTRTLNLGLKQITLEGGYKSDRKYLKDSKNQYFISSFSQNKNESKITQHTQNKSKNLKESNSNYTKKNHKSISEMSIEEKLDVARGVFRYNK